MSTPYDNACKILQYECTQLIVPIINRYFGEDLPSDVCIEIVPNELLFRSDRGAGGHKVPKRYADAFYLIRDRLYHLECQASRDGDLIVRVVEYGFLAAIRSKRHEGRVLELSFPRSIIIGLRHDAVPSEPYIVRMILPDGTSHSYEIPTIRMRDITLDDIFDGGLYFLLPFVLFRHEHEFEQIEHDADLLGALEREFDELREKFEQHLRDGRLDPKIGGILGFLLGYVSKNAADKHPAIKERVTEMEHEMPRIPFLEKWNEVEARGIALGEARGIALGEARGIALGEARGIALGEARGIALGEARGRAEGELDMLFSLVRDDILRPDIAAERAHLSTAAFNAKMAERYAQR